METNLTQIVLWSLTSPYKDEKHLPGQQLLVGRTIKHTFKDSENSDTSTDYIGFVINTVPGHPDWYNVKYRGDTAVYTYQLQMSYADGSLTIFVGKENMSYGCLIFVQESQRL